MLLKGALCGANSLQLMQKSFKNYYQFQIARNMINLMTDIPTVDERGRHLVTMLPGMGIGPEMMNYLETVISVSKAPIAFERFETETPDHDPLIERAILERAIKSILKNKVAIQGSLEIRDTTMPNLEHPNLYLRRKLNLFANVIRVRSIPNIPSKIKNLDVVVIRQNTEGEYSLKEHAIRNNIVQSLKIVTREKSQELAKYACQYAKIHGRTKITIIHKANIQKFSDGLFLDTARSVCANYKDLVETNEMIIDNACMQIVSDPSQFDVILAPNLYGAIITNCLCGLTGGPGLMGGANFGKNAAIFETACRNVGMHLVGKNQANPMSTILAATDLLIHLRHRKEAKTIKNAVLKTVCIDKIRTPDIGGKNTLSDMVKSICENIMFS